MRPHFFLAASLLPGVVYAQPRTAETIIVTAAPIASPDALKQTARSNFSDLEAPFVVASVSAQKLSDAGLTSLQDALRGVPGTAPVQGIGGFNTRFRLRGFVANNNLRNGFRQQLAFPIVEVAAIERIDVLKGPASALYGRLEPGGVLNIVTKTPQDQPFTMLSFSGDSEGLLRATGDANHVFGNGLKGRLNAVVDNGEGFRDFVNNKTRFLATVLSYSDAATDVIIEAEHSKRDGVFDRGFVSSPVSLTLPQKRFLGEPGDRFENETNAGSARVVRRVSDSTTLKIGAALSSSNSTGDYFFPIGIGGVPLLTSSGILNRRNQATQDAQDDMSVGWEVTTRFKTGEIEHFALVAGEWSKDESQSQIRRSTVDAPLSVINPIYGASRSAVTANIVNTLSKNEGVGALFQVESKFGSSIRTTLAVRADRLRARFTDKLTGITGTSDDTKILPRIGLTYLPTPSVALFANWGQSFAPEAGTRPIVDQASAKPSIGEQLEIGARYQSQDENIRLSASAFQITKSNVRVAEAAPSIFDRQVGEQRSQGFEFDAAVRLNTTFTVEGAYTYTNAEITRDRILAGKLLAAVPNHAALVSLRAQLRPSLALTVSGYHVGERFVDPANTFVLTSYERLDAALLWEPRERVTLQLNILNLADAKYFENGNTNNNFYPGQPRTVRASLKLRL